MTDLIKIEEDAERINDYACVRIDILNKFDDLTKFMTFEEKLNLYNTNAYYYTVDDYLKDLIELEYMYNGIYNYNMPLKLKNIFFNYSSVNDSKDMIL